MNHMILKIAIIAATVVMGTSQAHAGACDNEDPNMEASCLQIKAQEKAMSEGANKTPIDAFVGQSTCSIEAGGKVANTVLSTCTRNFSPAPRNGNEIIDVAGSSAVKPYGSSQAPTDK